MDERQPSMRLFPIAFRNMPDRASVVVDHRENAIAKLGARYSGFSLAGIKGIARERKRATIYMMLFKIEQVAYTFSIDPGTPDISVGLDVLTEDLMRFSEGAANRWQKGRERMRLGARKLCEVFGQRDIGGARQRNGMQRGT